MTDPWTEFEQSPDAREISRGMVEEWLLFAYFSGPRPIASAAPGPEVYERGGHLFGRDVALGIAVEYCRAGVEYDGGTGEEFR